MALNKVIDRIKKFGLLDSSRRAKKFGQNFLCNLDITRKIVKLSGTVQGRCVLEIGPGPGALSQSILEQDPKKIFLVEKDPKCVSLLQETFKHMDCVEIITADFLNLDLNAYPAPLKVIANLPYNVSSPILLKLIKHRRCIENMTLMFQKECAQRIVAPPCSKTYGRLSVIVQTFFKPKIVYTLPPSVFMPAPKVDSCVVYFEPRQEDITCNVDLLEHITRLLFSQRRKTLRKILKSTKLKAPAHCDLNRRPETLTVDELLAFCQENVDNMDIQSKT